MSAPQDEARKLAEDIRLDLDIPGAEAADAEARIAAILRPILAERDAALKRAEEAEAAYYALRG